MACVTFSALNCLETLHKFSAKHELNFSDRFTATMSGTSKLGNTLWAVAESIKSDGLVLENNLPSYAESFNDYFAPPAPVLREEGRNFLLRNKITTEFVPTDPKVMYEALGAAPLQVAINAYSSPTGGVSPRSELRPNHAISLVHAEYGKYWTVLDHYNKNNPLEHKIAWDYLFWGTVLYNLMPIAMQFQADHLYQLASEPGGFYLYAHEKLMKVETADHALAWLFRAGANWHEKTAVITKADLIGQQIYNFKGEKI
jgi:hypothetical protein